MNAQQEQDVFLALKATLASGLFFDLAWMAYYTYLARWWENRFGRAIFAKSVVISCLIVATFVPLFWPWLANQFWFQCLDVFLVFLVTPVMIWRIAANHYYRPPEKSLRLAARTAPRRIATAWRARRRRKNRREQRNGTP